MNKTANRLAISMLSISVLVLVSGTVLGIDYGNTTPTGNMAVTNATNVTATATYVEENSTETNASNITETTQPMITPAETETASLPAETVVPVETTEVTPVPTPTPKSPGFESILAVAAILAIGCMIVIRRR